MSDISSNNPTFFRQVTMHPGFLLGNSPSCGKFSSMTQHDRKRTNRRAVHRFKPAAPAHTHLLAAAIMWSLVGLMLGIRGLLHIDLTSWTGWMWAAGALIIGFFKGQFVLKKSARRAIKRILERGDDKCLGGFMSVKSWLLIASMIIMGKLLRASPLPRDPVWSVYVAVGTALLVSSRFFYQAHFERKKDRFPQTLHEQSKQG